MYSTLRRRIKLIRIQREERVSKVAKTTHKDRVQEFNSKLDKLRCVAQIFQLLQQRN